MVDSSPILTAISQWWPFGAFILGAIAAYWSGRKRQEFDIEILGRQQRELLNRVARLEDQYAQDGRTLTAIRTTLDHLAGLVNEVRQQNNHRGQ